MTIEALTREQRIAIQEAHSAPGCVGAYALKRYEETVKQAEALQAAFAGVVYAFAGGAGELAIRVLCASYDERARETCEQGYRFMPKHYAHIAKALLALLVALEDIAR